MARPNKIGLDYFPFNVNTDTNMKLSLIEAEFGLKGFAVYVKLLQRIYGERGYYMDWNEDVKLILAKAFVEPGTLVGEIISGCIRRGLFDKSVFDAFGVLTSVSIQHTYLTAIDRRDKVAFDLRFALIDINAYKNIVSVDINEVNEITNPQSKVEKSKVEKSKETAPKGFDFEKKLIEYGFEKKLVEEWLLIRKRKRAVNSETAFNRFIKEVEKTGRAANEILELVVSKSWQGFEASWINTGNNGIKGNNQKQHIGNHSTYGKL